MSVIETNLNSAQLRETLRRDGDTVTIAYGYNSGGVENCIYFITENGDALAIDTVIDKIATIDFTNADDPETYLVRHAVNYEDPDLYDGITGAKIPAHYQD